MSKIVKGVKKGIKKVGKFVKKHWKPIAIAAAVAFTGGLATVGFSGFSSAVASQGILGGIGSTMWAGATAMAGTIGLGSGAAGSAAAGAGMTGATMFNGALAGSFGATTAAQTAAQTAATNAGNFALGSNSFTAGAAQGAGQGIGQQIVQQGINQGVQQGGRGLIGNVLNSPIAPALINAGAAYLGQRGEEEDREPRASWGVAMGGGQSYQPWGTDGYQPVPPVSRPSTSGLLDPNNPAFRNSGSYG